LINRAFYHSEEWSDEESPFSYQAGWILKLIIK
jgi:hypothetical protein